MKKLILLLMIFSVACGYRVKNIETVTEFHVDGFIDRNTFQVITTSAPEKNITGLVNQRDSAYMLAYSNIKDHVMNKLIDEYLAWRLHKIGKNDASEIKNLEEVKSQLKEKFSKLLKYGRIAFEYFTENNSIILGYRIEKNGLKNEIESMNIDLKFDNPPDKK